MLKCSTGHCVFTCFCVPHILNDLQITLVSLFRCPLKSPRLLEWLIEITAEGFVIDWANEKFSSIDSCHRRTNDHFPIIHIDLLHNWLVWEDVLDLNNLVFKRAKSKDFTPKQGILIIKLDFRKKLISGWLRQCCYLWTWWVFHVIEKCFPAIGMTPQPQVTSLRIHFNIINKGSHLDKLWQNISRTLLKCYFSQVLYTFPTDCQYTVRQMNVQLK